MDFDKTFQDRFRELRGEKNLTQGEIADELGVSKASVAMWEIGKRTPPLKTLREIAEYFDCRLDYLLGTSDDRWGIFDDSRDDENISAAEEEDQANEAREYYRSVLRKFASLDAFGRSLVTHVLDEEAARCRVQNTLREDTSWLQINIQVNPRRDPLSDISVEIEEFEKREAEIKEYIFKGKKYSAKNR